jgi:predicted enzyme related to lactoylglutathione lyase
MDMSATAKPQNVAVWFEIPAADFERAVSFYEKVFDKRLTRDKFGAGDMAIFPHEGEANSGAIMKAEGYRPAGDGSVVYLSAGDDLAVALARATRAGGKVAIPKTQLPDGLGFFAQFIDSEGNRVGLHSMH